MQIAQSALIVCVAAELEIRKEQTAEMGAIPSKQAEHWQTAALALSSLAKANSKITHYVLQLEHTRASRAEV
jgi:hypothetical protein